MCAIGGRASNGLKPSAPAIRKEPEFGRTVMSASSEWLEVWHLRKVIFPRRTITGRLAWGQVWRRLDGRRWIYKQYNPPG